MIMINGNWEQVKALSDIVRIVNANIGYEFAQKVEEICGDSEDKIEDLEICISELQIKADRLKEFDEQLDILEDYIDENKDGIDYMRGIQKAYDMMKR